MIYIKSVKFGSFIKGTLNFLLIYFFPNRKRRMMDAGFSVPSSVLDIEDLSQNNVLYYITDVNLDLWDESLVDDFRDSRRNLKVSDAYFKKVDKLKKSWATINWFCDGWPYEFESIYSALVSTDSRVTTVLSVLGTAVDHAIRSCYRSDDVVIKGPPRGSLLHKVRESSFMLWKFSISYDHVTQRLVMDAESTLCTFNFINDSFSSCCCDQYTIVSRDFYRSIDSSSRIKTLAELADEARSELDAERAARHLSFQNLNSAFLVREDNERRNHSDDEIDL